MTAKFRDQFLNDNMDLRRRLEEAEATLRAIREGEVDAIIVSGPGGDQVFSLTGTESVYRQIVETMKEAALTVALDGTILYGNDQFARLLERPLEQIVGRHLSDFVTPQDRASAVILLEKAQQESVKMRLVFLAPDCSSLPTHISTNVLNQPGGASICMVAADLRELENSTELILRLRRQGGELRSANHRTQTILERMSDGFVMFDSQWRYRYLNNAASELFHVSPDQLIGKTLWDMWPAAFDLPVGEYFRRAVEQNTAQQFECFYPDPLNMWFECRCHPTAEGLAVFFSDITSRKLDEAALVKSRDQLEQRVRERTIELHLRAEQLAHLTGELSLAEQRERNRLAQVLHDGLQQLLVAAKFRLSVLDCNSDSQIRKEIAALGELLDSSIETSRSLTAELSPPVLREGGFTAALQWLVRWMREKHGLTIEFEPPEKPVRISENVAVLLFQSARELLFNIVKHAGVRSAKMAAQQTGSQLLLSVTDEGVGFDPLSLRGSGGHSGGFGLFAMHERLELLGGFMEMESEVGGGSRFTLTVPLMPKTEEIAPSANGSSVMCDTRSSQLPVEPETCNCGRAPGLLRVALVDDHIVVRQGLASLLRREKRIEIAGEASDGAGAVSLVRRLRPDVVLMDISMPGMSGIEATRLIHEEFPEVRIIGLSMHENADMARQMRDAGAVGYVSKSGASEAIIGVILECCSQDAMP